MNESHKEYLKNEMIKEALSWGKIILFAVIFALFLNNFVIVNASVPTGSMEDTIMIGDRIVAFRLSYLLDGPKRFDIVVFRYPEDESKLYVKRVIGLPGETIEIKNGKVYVNGGAVPLPDGFIKDPPNGEWGPFYVPEGRYFMLGDNRDTSADSRKWEDGYQYVERSKILGKVIFRYFPGIKTFSEIKTEN
ncbi:MAG: signal peptidase I [Defluviitaleaceae bacterium]|nr:signal peptidase I [Defluviitaleaceae bacterium]